MRLILILASLLAVDTTSAVAAPQIPAGELPGRERERFIERPGESLLLRRAPTTVLPWETTPSGPRRCRLHVTRSSRTVVRRKGCP
jgi:hypothetical protein